MTAVRASSACGVEARNRVLTLEETREDQLADFVLDTERQRGKSRDGIIRYDCTGDGRAEEPVSESVTVSMSSIRKDGRRYRCPR